MQSYTSLLLSAEPGLVEIWLQSASHNMLLKNHGKKYIMQQMLLYHFMEEVGQYKDSKIVYPFSMEIFGDIPSESSTKCSYTLTQMVHRCILFLVISMSGTVSPRMADILLWKPAAVKAKMEHTGLENAKEHPLAWTQNIPELLLGKALTIINSPSWRWKKNVSSLVS